MSYIEHDDAPVLTPAEQRLANAEQRVAQLERENAKLREALKKLSPQTTTREEKIIRDALGE